MRRVAYCLALLVVFGLVPTLRGHGQEPKGMRELMQRKLQHAQKVLEGVALGDFDRIAAGGGELIEVSKAAEWKVVKTPQYELYSNEFRRNAESLADAAKARNLDGAALAYVDLTLSCVKCHKHVRETRMTRRD
jgi:hypothetical protein